VIRPLMVLVGVLGTTPVAAEGYQGTGRVTVLPSFRLSLQDPFYDAAARGGRARLPGASGGPGLIGSFAYAAAENFEVSIDPFVATELLAVQNAQPIRAWIYGATLGGRAQAVIDGQWFPFLGVHSGPVLVYAGGPPDVPYAESVGQAFAASVGVAWRFQESWGAVIQYQYLYGGELDTALGRILGRGHWFSIGFTRYFPKDGAGDDPR
jgi:hypothetical protein